jgi:hypothetical protein
MANKNKELLHKANMVYVGAFRVPVHNQPDGTYGYYYGGTALAYNGWNDTLVMCGHDHKQWMGEFFIPEPLQADSINDLNTAEVVQEPSDWLEGERSSVDGGVNNGTKIGGCIPLGPEKYMLSVWCYYDASAAKQTKSHFLLLRHKDEISEARQVGKGWQKYYPPDTQTIAGMVSGYMCNIPSEYHSIAGATHLTGQGGGISVVNRTSSGPSATIFNPLADNLVETPRLVMGYPSIDQTFVHLTLGVWGEGGGTGLYDGTQYFRGMLFPDGAKSVLYFGWGGSAFCYGSGSNDPNKHEVPLDPPQYDANGELVHYCYDPINSSKGTHGYPYRSIVYAYDFDDFLEAKDGNKNPYDVVPYETWDISPLPFQQKMVDGVDKGDYSIVGAAWKPSTREIFLSAYRQDGDRPLIHVFRLD